jgi:CheY-like chemotaxis protein
MTAAGWRILVVEDDGLIAMAIEEILEELGHTVIGPIRAVEAALAAIETEAIDVALLDINLGNGTTSFPVAEALSYRGVPFAFLTGYGEADLNGRFGGRPVISKPIEVTHLAQTLRDIGRS